jgi:2-desacetyl-2-hydroxyethyl bacteriochlorophyllide A dehydrogenase
LVVVEPGKIELQKTEIDPAIEPNEALVRAEYSVVSAGTEGAGFTGLIREMPFGDRGAYPRGTGYGHLGEVLGAGADVKMCKPGDRVLSFSPHASVVKADAARMALPVPRDGDGRHLVFARMAGVSISALRSSSVQPGDTVLVIGMGLVGNFAAQLFRMAGAEVMVADLSDARLDRARACGIDRTVNPAEGDLDEAVMDWTEGKGVHIAVEAIGISEAVSQAVMVTRRHGEVILLGSPRARATFDVTPMLLRIHLEAIRMIGSLEWRWPQHETERARDLTTNYRQIVDWIARGELAVEPLMTHVASPEECQRMYDGLTQAPDEYLGVVFDWGLL